MRSLSWASTLAPAALGLALSTSGCAGSCSAAVAYSHSNVTLPSNDLDCTLTLAGATNQATYDCPPPPSSGGFSSCSAQGSAPPIQGTHSSAGQYFQSDVSPYFTLSIDDTNSRMTNYLGSSSFTLTLTCGGMTILNAPGQQFGKTQYCEG